MGLKLLNKDSTFSCSVGQVWGVLYMTPRRSSVGLDSLGSLPGAEPHSTAQGGTGFLTFAVNSPQSFLSHPLRLLLKRSLHRPLSLVLFLWESKQTSETRFCSPMKWTCYMIKSKELFTGQNMEKRHIKRDEKTVRSEVIPGYQLTCGGPPKSWAQINV